MDSLPRRGSIRRPDSYTPARDRYPTGTPSAMGSSRSSYCPSRLQNYTSAGECSDRYHGSDVSTPIAGNMKRPFDDSNGTYSRVSKMSRASSQHPGGLLGQVRSKVGKQVWSKETFKLGTILKCVHAEEAYAGGSQISEANKIYGPNGVVLCGKERHLIVVGQYDTNYIAIPMYTFNGRGLEHKTEKLEYISIRDHRYPSATFKALSPHDPLKTYKLIQEMPPFPDTSCAWLTYPVARVYSLPVLIEGCLDPMSTKRIIDLVRRYAPKPLAAVPDSGKCEIVADKRIPAAQPVTPRQVSPSQVGAASRIAAHTELEEGEILEKPTLKTWSMAGAARLKATLSQTGPPTPVLNY